MTREEFETTWLGRGAWNALVAEDLHRLGRMAAPCSCGDPVCRGWQMLHIEGLLPEEMATLPEPYQAEARRRQRERATAVMGTKGRP